MWWRAKEFNAYQADAFESSFWNGDDDTFHGVVSGKGYVHRAWTEGRGGGINPGSCSFVWKGIFQLHHCPLRTAGTLTSSALDQFQKQKLAQWTNNPRQGDSCVLQAQGSRKGEIKAGWSMDKKSKLVWFFSLTPFSFIVLLFKKQLPVYYYSR